MAVIQRAILKVRTREILEAAGLHLRAARMPIAGTVLR
jgi:hypothetical protein